MRAALTDRVHRLRLDALPTEQCDKRSGCRDEIDRNGMDCKRWWDANCGHKGDRAQVRDRVEKVERSDERIQPWTKIRKREKVQDERGDPDAGERPACRIATARYRLHDRIPCKHAAERERYPKPGRSIEHDAMGLAARDMKGDDRDRGGDKEREQAQHIDAEDVPNERGAIARFRQREVEMVEVAAQARAEDRREQQANECDDGRMPA